MIPLPELFKRRALSRRLRVRIARKKESASLRMYLVWRRVSPAIRLFLQHILFPFRLWAYNRIFLPAKILLFSVREAIGEYLAEIRLKILLKIEKYPLLLWLYRLLSRLYWLLCMLVNFLWERVVIPTYLLIRKTMRRLARRFPGPFYSTWLHLALFALVMGSPFSCARKTQDINVITVEILPVGEVNNIIPQQREKPKPKESPVKAKPEPKPELAVPMKNIPSPQFRPKPKPKPKPEPKPEEKPTPEEKKKPDFDSVLKSVEEMEKKAASEKQSEKKGDKDDIEISSDITDYDENLPVSVTEIALIKSQIRKCWIVPAGARDAQNMAVRLRISLNKDGTVTKVEILDSSRYMNRENSFFRAAADAARRAVIQCSPIKGLPVKKYGSWKEIELNFDPSDMIF